MNLPELPIRFLYAPILVLNLNYGAFDKMQNKNIIIFDEIDECFNSLKCDSDDEYENKNKMLDIIAKNTGKTLPNFEKLEDNVKNIVDVLLFWMPDKHYKNIYLFVCHIIMTNPKKIFSTYMYYFYKHDKIKLLETFVQYMTLLCKNVLI
jgi:hypothetical protein